jgi:hypothetical protein
MSPYKPLNPTQRRIALPSQDEVWGCATEARDNRTTAAKMTGAIFFSLFFMRIPFSFPGDDP